MALTRRSRAAVCVRIRKIVSRGCTPAFFSQTGVGVGGVREIRPWKVPARAPTFVTFDYGANGPSRAHTHRLDRKTRPLLTTLSMCSSSSVAVRSSSSSSSINSTSMLLCVVLLLCITIDTYVRRCCCRRTYSSSTYISGTSYSYTCVFHELVRTYQYEYILFFLTR